MKVWPESRVSPFVILLMKVPVSIFLHFADSSHVMLLSEMFYYFTGNLCWESALEEDLWSKLMIAPLYNNALDGDVQMRQQWLTITNR